MGGHPTPKENPNQFINDPHGIANIIRGDPQNERRAREDDKGHFHVTAQFRFILEGQIEIKIGSIPTVVDSDQGDIDYAPVLTWHRIRFAGERMTLRPAILEYMRTRRPFNRRARSQVRFRETKRFGPWPWSTTPS